MVWLELVGDTKEGSNGIVVLIVKAEIVMHSW